MKSWVFRVACMLAAATGAAAAADSVEEDQEDVARNNTREAVIFTSNQDIINILAYHIQDCYEEINETTEFTEPIIFFSVVDNANVIPPRSFGQFFGYGSYENRVFRKILENGLCVTVDDSEKRIAYIGAENGIYTYNVSDGIVSKLGPINDTVIQIKKAHGQDNIYILTAPDNRIYKVSKDGITKTLIDSIPCAVNFVLDYEDNIFYHCDDYKLYVLTQDSTIPVAYDMAELRHGFLSFPLDSPEEKNVSFFADDGIVYSLKPDGTYYERDAMHHLTNSTSFAVDPCLQMFFALQGKLIEVSYRNY